MNKLFIPTDTEAWLKTITLAYQPTRIGSNIPLFIGYFKERQNEAWWNTKVVTWLSTLYCQIDQKCEVTRLKVFRKCFVSHRFAESLREENKTTTWMIALSIWLVSVGEKNNQKSFRRSSFVESCRRESKDKAPWQITSSVILDPRYWSESFRK